MTCVVQAYYQAGVELETSLKEIKCEVEESSDVEEKRKNSKGGVRKAKRHKIRLSLVKGGSVIKEKKELSNRFDETALLDYLVSPLKADLAFGRLIRELVFKRDCDL